jgi:hypothetical protein
MPVVLSSKLTGRGGGGTRGARYYKQRAELVEW